MLTSSGVAFPEVGAMCRVQTREAPIREAVTLNFPSGLVGVAGPEGPKNGAASHAIVPATGTTRTLLVCVLLDAPVIDAVNTALRWPLAVAVALSAADAIVDVLGIETAGNVTPVGRPDPVTLTIAVDAVRATVNCSAALAPLRGTRMSPVVGETDKMTVGVGVEAATVNEDVLEIGVVAPFH